MRVTQIANNQMEIRTEKGIYFQSYDSIVAFRPYSGKIKVGRDWDYSRTTMKYVGQFLGQNTAKTRKDIEAGIIEVDENLGNNL